MHEVHKHLFYSVTEIINNLIVNNNLIAVGNKFSL